MHSFSRVQLLYMETNTSVVQIQILCHFNRDLYGRLEEETGQATGLAQVGFIELAPDQDHLEEYVFFWAGGCWCTV